MLDGETTIIGNSWLNDDNHIMATIIRTNAIIRGNRRWEELP